MPLIFPTNPSVNQTYQSGSSSTYQWNGSYWETITPPTQTVLTAATASSVSTLNQPITISGSLTVFTGSAVELQVTNTGVRLGNTLTDVHQATGSLIVSGSTLITGSFAVSTGSGIEFQVLDNGVRMGNLITDRHTVTGSMFVSSSLTVSGSLNISGSLILNISGSITGSTINPPTLVQAYNQSGFSVPNNSSTIVAGWTSSFTQNASEWNAATGIFTARKAATYLVSVTLIYNPVAGTIGNQVNCAINKNFDAITTAANFITYNATAVDRPTGTCTALVNLVAGETIRISAYQNTGAALTLASGNPYINTICIQQVPARIIH